MMTKRHTQRSAVNGPVRVVTIGIHISRCGRCPNILITNFCPELGRNIASPTYDPIPAECPLQRFVDTETDV